ncbi:MAG: hypothetical protein ACRCYY_11890 [Trueperaceae bacterium]
MKPGDIRDEIWTTLIKERAASYPLPPYGHNPNFKGSSDAATLLLEYLLTHSFLKVGDTVLSYPDNVLKALRKALLDAGIHVIVPAKFGKAYKLLKAGAVESDEVSSISGADKLGETCQTLPSLSMTFVACVALNPQGYYLDKGYGFHLPEGVLESPSATLVHPLQLIEDSFDTRRVKVYATPEQVIKVKSET